MVNKIVNKILSEKKKTEINKNLCVPDSSSRNQKHTKMKPLHEKISIPFPLRNIRVHAGWYLDSYNKHVKT